MNVDKLNILPENLNEAVEMLKTFSFENIGDIKSMTEEEMINACHFNLGMFIRNQWNLWWYDGHTYEEWGKDKPKLVEWFNSIGIVHADDMSTILLTCLHRNVHGKDYELEEQVENYKNYWREQGYPDGIPKIDRI